MCEVCDIQAILPVLVPSPSTGLFPFFLASQAGMFSSLLPSAYSLPQLPFRRKQKGSGYKEMPRKNKPGYFQFLRAQNLTPGNEALFDEIWDNNQ